MVLQECIFLFVLLNVCLLKEYYGLTGIYIPVCGTKCLFVKGISWSCMIVLVYSCPWDTTIYPVRNVPTILL